MGIKEANIYLDNQWNTYYAGQTVNGRIEYVFDSPKKVRGIHVKFKGEAHTEWSESKQEEDSQGKSQSSDTLHTGNEEYFQISYYLLGNNSGGEIEIPAGKQVYNFTCALPPVLPSSFEGEYGYVRYTIKVEPIHFQMEKTFCCFCCASLPLSVDVRAPVSGYCPGQVIPLTVDIENKSNVQLHLVKVFLRKVVTYRTTSPSTAIKKCKDIIVTIQEGPVPAGITKQYLMNIEVPPMPPSNLVNCSIIDLDYDLKVVCAVSGMHLNLKDRKYVTIGTVPLVGMAGQTPSAPPLTSGDNSPAVLPVGPGQPAQPMAPTGSGEVPPGGWVVPGSVPAQPPFQSLYPSLSEPVYKESNYSARTIQDRNESSHMAITGPANFAPYYPTYAAVQPPPLPQ
ncbi:unnamed protein product [Leptidea sinapis]|uniref:Arrestin C-terminal-like domain-containing protein n=1 Tax=Leptidea sinapis TaxID=189913 RepID=A0A5E4QDU4_9NEOP|nr:unnamed protein product [Leptidea sinapis]